MLLRIVAGVFLVFAFVNVIWILGFPYTVTATVLSGGTDSFDERVMKCTSDNHMFLFLNFVLFGIVLAWDAWIAFKTKTLPSQYNEVCI